MMNTTKWVVVLALILILVALVGLFLNRTNELQGPPLVDGVCTEEARICDDGTTVVRSGPNCEYAPCP